MITVDYLPENCTDCGSCDLVYPGIRTLFALYRDLSFSVGEWAHISRPASAAAAACKHAALIVEERPR